MRGFTLIEILVALFIFGLIAAGLFGVLNAGKIIFKDDITLVGLQQEARLGMDAMSREIRESGPAHMSFSDANAKVTFSIVPEVYGNPWVGPISYYCDTNDVNSDGIANQLIREYPTGVFKILANDISVLNFSLAGNVLNIGLAAKTSARGRDLCFPSPCQAPQKLLNEAVMLRNYNE